jgi:hypothetical protein
VKLMSAGEQDAFQSLWRREPVVLGLVLPAVAALAAGCAVATSHPTVGGPVGVTSAVAGLLGLLIRQGVFSPATVATIGKDALLAEQLGQQLQAHHDELTKLIENLLSQPTAELPAADLEPAEFNARMAEAKTEAQQAVESAQTALVTASHALRDAKTGRFTRRT